MLSIITNRKNPDEIKEMGSCLKETKPLKVSALFNFVEMLLDPKNKKMFKEHVLKTYKIKKIENEERVAFVISMKNNSENVLIANPLYQFKESHLTIDKFHSPKNGMLSISHYTERYESTGDGGSEKQEIVFHLYYDSKGRPILSSCRKPSDFIFKPDKFLENLLKINAEPALELLIDLLALKASEYSTAARLAEDLNRKIKTYDYSKGKDNILEDKFNYIKKIDLMGALSDQPLMSCTWEEVDKIKKSMEANNSSPVNEIQRIQKVVFDKMEAPKTEPKIEKIEDDQKNTEHLEKTEVVNDEKTNKKNNNANKLQRDQAIVDSFKLSINHLGELISSKKDKPEFWLEVHKTFDTLDEDFREAFLFGNIENKEMKKLNEWIEKNRNKIPKKRNVLMNLFEAGAVDEFKHFFSIFPECIDESFVFDLIYVIVEPDAEKEVFDKFLDVGIKSPVKSKKMLDERMAICCFLFDSSEVYRNFFPTISSAFFGGDSFKVSFLCRSFCDNNFKVFSMLLEHGFLPNSIAVSRKARDETKEKFISILKLVLSRKSDTTNLPYVQKLIEHGALFDKKDDPNLKSFIKISHLNQVFGSNKIILQKESKKVFKSNEIIKSYCSKDSHLSIFLAYDFKFDLMRVVHCRDYQTLAYLAPYSNLEMLTMALEKTILHSAQFSFRLIPGAMISGAHFVPNLDLVQSLGDFKFTILMHTISRGAGALIVFPNNPMDSQSIACLNDFCATFKKRCFNNEEELKSLIKTFKERAVTYPANQTMNKLDAIYCAFLLKLQIPDPKSDDFEELMSLCLYIGKMFDELASEQKIATQSTVFSETAMVYYRMVLKVAIYSNCFDKIEKSSSRLLEISLKKIKNKEPDFSFAAEQKEYSIQKEFEFKREIFYQYQQSNPYLLHDSSIDKKEKTLKPDLDAILDSKDAMITDAKSRLILNPIGNLKGIY